MTEVRPPYPLDPQAPAAPEPPSRAKLLFATIFALLLAAAVLVAIVLPAEYGVDPFGTGERLGLIVLSDPTAIDIPVREDGLTAQPAMYRIDRKVFEVEPGSFMEYKYRLEAGETMVYSWAASRLVRSEMHSEADGAPAGTAEFFEVLESATEAHGSYVAPFPGDHGWYWLNEHDVAVTITLYAAGFFDDSIEYRPQVDPLLRQMDVSPEELYAEPSPGAPVVPDSVPGDTGAGVPPAE
jgi:hypothetical protein